MSSVTFDISSAEQLAQDIAAIDQGGASATAATFFTFDIAPNATLALADPSFNASLPAINLEPERFLTIVGNGATIDGGGTYSGLFVYNGPVNIDNLTIADARAAGGSGGAGGGGGAGLGGGLFVGASADVTLSGVNFINDAAVGGNGGVSGGFGGGGGLLGGEGGRPLQLRCMVGVRSAGRRRARAAARADRRRPRDRPGIVSRPDRARGEHRGAP